MDIKVVSSIVGFAFATSVGGIAQAATETTETTIERSTTVEAPKPAPRVKEETTTTTKRGLFGRTKSETKTTRVERDPDSANSTEVKSRTTTTQTERSY
jgi:hypothetical protein